METTRMIAARNERAPLIVRLTRAGKLARMRAVGAVEVADPNLVRTARLVIRPLAWTDRDEVCRVLAASRAHLEAHCPVHRDDESDGEAFDRLLEMSRRGLELGRAWRAAVFDVAGRLVGMVNLNDIVRGLENTAEANWWISADACRRGFASEAVRGLLAHAFTDLPRGLGLHRVEAVISPDNEPSRRVAERAGMRPARDGRGLGRSIELAIGGRPVMHEVFEVFAPLTAPAPARRSRTSMRAGLASILTTEAAARAHVC